MINEATRLHRIGFGIHWLKTKSKAPVKSGWTTGPREEIAALKKQYRPGLNMGVRLGHASCFEDGTYLTVIDCDVKSEEPRHLAAMLEKLKELGVGDRAPTVMSGRGNGSRHIYVRTETPMKPARFAQAGGVALARVYMPSVAPSSRDKKILQAKEIADGYRVRAPWEISIMGEGQQVVLPPSIHPDSGKAYLWVNPVKSFSDIPLVQLEKGKTAPGEAEKAKAKGFQLVDLDLELTTLPEKIVRLIVDGEGCEDRSAALFLAAITMVKEGFSDDEILSVLTDRDNFLGSAGYDHAKTESRDKAAEWVRKYTLTKAKKECDAATAFENDVEDVPLTDEEAETQMAEIAGAVDWRSKIERSGDHAGARPKCTMLNVHLILTNEATRDFVRRDEFSWTDSYTVNTPWGGQKGHELKDIDLVRIKKWLSTHYRFEPGTQVILEAIQAVADQYRFHPVRNFVNSLDWDGVPRVDQWLKTYLHAEGPEDYVTAVGRKTLVAMVARVLQPGCKFDNVLVLEGPQGCGKSTVVKTLAEPWFSDAMINIGDKDAVLAMRLAWVMELGELTSLRKSEVDQLKQFISQPTDRIRLPYGKLAEAFPRQCIFIGTTNSSEYLKDTTGNRRFWPVKVDKCDTDALARDRAQLLAEARFIWELGEPLYLEDKRIEAAAVAEQADRVFVDTWVDKLQVFFLNPGENFPARFTIGDLFGDWGPLATYKDTKAEQMRAAECLRFLGFEKKKARIDGLNTAYWTKKGDL